MQLRVATYNIHKGVSRQFFGLRRLSTIHDLRQRLHELESDLVFLQEVQGQHDRHAAHFAAWPEEPQNVFLAKSAQKRHVFETAYGKNSSYLHGHHGNALLSRFPIVRKDNRDVSDHGLEKRGILHCVVRVERRHVHCFVIHFGLLAASRMRQTQMLASWIEKEVPPSAPLLIAGDFNDWRDKLSQTMYKRLGVQEVFDEQRQSEKKGTQLFTSIRKARTFPSLLPWLRMDRIYQRGFKTTQVKVLGGPAWARLSDHAPLVADLTLLAVPSRD